MSENLPSRVSNTSYPRLIEQVRRPAPKLTEQGKALFGENKAFQEFLETSPEPWIQHESEPDDAFDAFQLWRGLAGQRTIERLILTINKGGYEYNDRTQLQNWLQLWRWEYRTKLYDDFLERDYDEELLERRRKMKRTRLDLFDKLNDKAKKVLEDLEDRNLSEKGMLALLKIYIELGQAEFPEVDDKPKIVINNNNDNRSAHVHAQARVANEQHNYNQLNDPDGDGDGDNPRELHNQRRLPEILALLGTTSGVGPVVEGEAREIHPTTDDEVHPTTTSEPTTNT